MRPIDLADQQLGEYKLRNGEVIAKSCPFCNPHRKDNLYKFYMNQQTGAFKCYRENNCGQTGSFYDLLKHFNLENEFEFEDGFEDDYQKSYKKPDPIEGEPAGKVAEYLDLRCISEETWGNEDVKEKDGNIAFEYYHNGELVLTKYRTANKDKKYWQNGGGKPVLWGIDDIDPNQPVVVCEGELDRLEILEAGYDNVVSVPFGTNNLKWIKECWEVLEEIDEFIIWADDDEAGEKMEKEVVKRLEKDKCRIVNCEYNDANLMLYKEGGQSILDTIEQAEYLPINEVVKFNEIEIFDPNKVEKVNSFTPKLNKYVGGFMAGMVTVWTGTNGSGKSTYLNREVLHCVEQNQPICLISGELRNDNLKYWLAMQAAGPNNIERKLKDNIHQRGEITKVEDHDKYNYSVDDETISKIGDWLDDNLFIYDDFAELKPDLIIETFKRLRKRYNCRNFVVDNLMILNVGNDYSHKYSKQADFIRKAKSFAKAYDSHVHVVAHPRKSDGIISKDDIAGLYEVTNLVDNIVGVIRVNEKSKPHLPDFAKKASNVLSLFKCRMYGSQDILIELDFDIPSKRFYPRGNERNKNYRYGWEFL